MHYYVHHIPGRLRVRIPALKANAAEGRDLIRAMREIPGVDSADLHLLTGSVLVHYDRRAETAAKIIEELKLGEGGSNAASNRVGSRIAKKSPRM